MKVRGLKESEYFIVCILVSMIFSDMVELPHSFDFILRQVEIFITFTIKIIELGMQTSHVSNNITKLQAIVGRLG